MGKLVGLTGNIGSGKSTVGRLLKEEGFFVVDADELIHRLYEEDEELKEKVRALFGEEVFTKGKVDRKKLAKVVFSDLKKLRRLEEITHSALYRELERLRRERREPVVVEASLIFEKGTEGRYDLVVLVYAPYELAKERALKRGFTEEDFNRRWRLQLPPEEKLKRAHLVLYNTGSLEELKKQVKELAKKLREVL